MEPFQEPCIINVETLNGPSDAGALGSDLKYVTYYDLGE